MARTRTRVLVGASSFADAASALNIASQLMKTMIGDLGGLLIEETDVVTTCSLPNQRVISVSGAVLMAPSPAQVRTMMKADARAFRRLLAEIASQPGAEWTFGQQSGELIERAMDAGHEWDVLIVGHRDIHTVPGVVVYLGTPSSGDDRALDIAATLAGELGTKLVAFSVGEADGSRSQVANLRFGTLEAALSQLTRTNAEAVVVDLSGGAVHSRDQLRRVLNVARCPVVVLGTSSLEPALEYSTIIPPAPNHKPD